MNDDHDNAQTDKEALKKYGPSWAELSPELRGIVRELVDSYIRAHAEVERRTGVPWPLHTVWRAVRAELFPDPVMYESPDCEHEEVRSYIHADGGTVDICVRCRAVRFNDATTWLGGRVPVEPRFWAPKPSIRWGQYPKLASIFEHRPIKNVYWTELLALLAEAQAEAVRFIHDVKNEELLAAREEGRAEAVGQAVGAQANPSQGPIPMLLYCPECSARHLDVGEFATKLHHTHACQRCGHVWRPALVATVGVQFLPGFKNAVEPSNGRLNCATCGHDAALHVKGLYCVGYQDNVHCVCPCLTTLFARPDGR